MRLNSDAANKLVKQLTKAQSALLHQESQVNTYSFLQGEEPFKPDYDFSATQAKLDQISEAIVALKHAINLFNTTTKLPGLDITVDMALVELPILSANAGRLEAMSRVLEKTRSTNMVAKAAEYTCRNYSAEEAAASGAAARKRLVAIQQGLNTVNMTETFEVDDSVKVALES